ncbi:hypothetical protein P350_10835 [Burkholderia cepacia JBK9]|nr:hypothetical protein P350_10835 [Burkholderia cepacia JBK9]
MSTILQEYFAALERLKNGDVLHVRKGTKITNNAVALEAGRGKGSIKKSRAIFSDLISAIEAATDEQSKKDQSKEKLGRATDLMRKYRKELDDALEREASLLNQVYELKKERAALQGGKVLPIRSKQQRRGG